MLAWLYYRIHSTRYRGILVRAVPIPVITAVISQKLFPVTTVFPRIYRSNIPVAALYSTANRSQTPGMTCCERKKPFTKQNVTERWGWKSSPSHPTPQGLSPFTSVVCVCIHTHTHPFNGPLSGTTRVRRYQKGKTNLDLLKQETVSGSGISCNGR